MQKEEPLLSASGENPHAAMKTQRNQKKETSPQALRMTNIKKTVLCRTWRNKSEPSWTTGGKAQRCSCSRRQACGSSRRNSRRHDPATPLPGTHPRENVCPHRNSLQGCSQQHSQQAGAHQPTRGQGVVVVFSHSVVAD